MLLLAERMAPLGYCQDQSAVMDIVSRVMALRVCPTRLYDQHKPSCIIFVEKHFHSHLSTFNETA